MDNAAQEGIFSYIPNAKKLPCPYVPFECKNYTTEVGNPEIDQLGGRFSANRGMLGLLCCRHFENRGLFIQRCRDTFQDGRGLILPLDDERILGFLKLIQQNQHREIDVRLSDLVAEIWAD